jgi:PAS domain S-box-containing protein
VKNTSPPLQPHFLPLNNIISGFLGLVLIAMLAGSLWFYRDQEKQGLRQEESELQVIARLKADQIVQWREERLADASVLTGGPFFAEGAAKWLASPSAAGADKVLVHLRTLALENRYSEILFVDPAGQVRLRVTGRTDPLGTAELPVLAEALRTGRAQLSDLHIDVPGVPPHMILAAPIFRTDGGLRAPLGAVIMEIQARQFLYSLIQTWPTPSPSAEFVLVRRDGDSVLYLNTLRHRQDVAFRLRRPLTEQASPEVQAALGRQGVFRGVDYRGIAVLTFLQPIAGTPWVLVAKIDESEALANWRFRAGLIEAAVLAALLAFGAAAWMLRQQRARYRDLVHSSAALAKMSRGYQLLSECNHALARADDEPQVMQAVCRLLVESGGYPLAWVGIAENDAEKSVRVAAQTGLKADYLKTLRINWSDGPLGRGPTGTAIRTGRTVVTQDFLTEPDFAPWCPSAIHHGLAASVSLPMFAQGRVFGALAVYSREANAFDSHERELLETLAADLSFGLSAVRSAATLRHEQTLLAGLLDSSPDHIYFKDRQSRFVRMNAAQARRFQLGSPEEAIGKTDADLFSADHAQQALADEQRIMATGEAMVGVEEKETWPDGRVTWVSTTKVPLKDESGRITGLAGISRDITAHKNVEAQLLQSQKMDALGQLAGGIAHDFNNILAAMILQLDMAKLEPDVSRPMQKWLSDIDQSAQRAAGLTRQMLLFGRRQVMERRPLELNEAVDGVCKMLRRLLGENIAFQLRKASAPLWIEADKSMVEQVVMNLCINARDAMPKGGELRIEVGDEEFPPTAPHPGRHGSITVADTGIGMSDAVKARIFEPFYTTKAIGKGSGLGLATVFGIMKQHRGWIEVESAPGRGSTFRVFFPAIGSILRPAEAVPVASPRGAESILLVEDDESVRAAAAACLRQAGYRVVEAPHGVAGLQQWDNHGGAFDLLLIDFLMPEGLTGLQLAEQLVLRKDSLQVIVMSGYASERDGAALVWPERFGRLAKPFKARALLDAVRQSLDLKQRGSGAHPGSGH